MPQGVGGPTAGDVIHVGFSVLLLISALEWSTLLAVQDRGLGSDCLRFYVMLERWTAATVAVRVSPTFHVLGFSDSPPLLLLWILEY